MDRDDVLEFWFNTLTPEQWWKKDTGVDADIQSKFSTVHQRAVRGELFEWRDTAEGRLAEIIVIDQFSRNMFRGDSRSYLYDPLALILSQEAIRAKADANLSIEQKAFMYMPWMHSESKVVHEHAVKLFSAPGLEDNLKFELDHKAIIDQFGRYPYRNEVLGRESTPEELEFLKQTVSWM